MTNEKLVTDNMKLVHAVINRLFPTYRGDEDVIGEGMLALVKAAHSFEKDSTVAFSTYAFCVIRNEIINYIRRERRYDSLLSLDEPLGDDGEGNEVTLGDTLASDDTAEYVEPNPAFEKVFTTLKERDKLIVVLRLRGYSYKEVAEKVSTSEANVRRVLRRIGRLINNEAGD